MGDLIITRFGKPDLREIIVVFDFSVSTTGIKILIRTGRFVNTIIDVDY